MALREDFRKTWRRKHDDPAFPAVPVAPRQPFPVSPEELIEICSRPGRGRIHAAGSHWGLSTAAISDEVFVETHDPGNVEQVMGSTLYDVVPKCLNPAFIDWLRRQQVPPFDAATVAENAGLYPIHFETGKRIYQLYAELDAGDTDPASLANLLAANGNPTYLGPWAFPTLGGAGGQTVFGALHTGTHGGDFRMPPIADSVMAMHLVADGGVHYWIERESLPYGGLRLTDDDALRSLYGQPPYVRRPEDFQIVRDDRTFNAVLISAGRFGIVYSIVFAAVRQYCLHQERLLSTWREVRDLIKDTNSAFYNLLNADGRQNRFLQIAVALTPHNNFRDNRVGITRRWNIPMVVDPATGRPLGRDFRRGRRLAALDPRLRAPLFEFAGANRTYMPDLTRPDAAKDADFLARACANADFMTGVMKEIEEEVKNFIDSNGRVLGPGLGAAGAALGGGGLPALLPALAILLAILAALIDRIGNIRAPRLGNALDIVRETLLNQPTPALRQAGLFVFHAIALKVFESQQEEGGIDAISYAMMDGYDYQDRSCAINADSVEVFFDATDPRLPAYVERLIAFEIVQEVTQANAFVGWLSLRFTGPGSALIGQARWPVTCAIEVAGLLDVRGTKELIDFAVALALHPTFNGILHWGQRNDARRADIEARFGSGPDNPLDQWRAALSQITGNGRLDAFSSPFTRQTGLEIVDPLPGTLTVAGGDLMQPIVIDWTCPDNPPGTEVDVELVAPSGATQTWPGLALSGQVRGLATERGRYEARLTLTLLRDSLRRSTQVVRRLVVS